MANRLVKWLVTGFGILAILITCLGSWVYLNKEDVFERAKRAVGESLNGGDLEIRDFKFTPASEGIGLTFSLVGISLKDSLFDTHRTPLMRIGQVSASFNILALLSGKVLLKELKLKDGDIRVFTDKTGYSNLSLFSRKENTGKKGKEGPENIFRKIKLLTFENVRVSYSDSVKEKFYSGILRKVQGSVFDGGRGWRAELKGSLFYEYLVFNKSKGAFLRNRETHTSLYARFREQTGVLELMQPSGLRLSGGELIRIEGALNLEQLGPMKLRFETERIGVRVASSLLPDSVAVKINRIGINTEARAKVDVIRKPGTRKPVVNIAFETDTFSYEIPVGFFRKVSAKGTFTNQADSTLPVSPENSRVQTQTVKGFFEEIPMEGNLRVADFRDPMARIDVLLQADSTNLASVFDPARYKVKKGNARIDLVYEGSLKRFYTPGTDSLRGKLRGTAVLRNLALSYLPSKINLSRMNSLITFDEKVIHIHRLDVFDQQNQLYIKGRVEDLVRSLLGAPEPAKAYVDVRIPRWQLNWLQTLLDGRQRKKKSKYKLSEVVDKTIENLEIVATLDAKNVSYYNFRAQNVKGKLAIDKQAARLESFALNAFGGTVTMAGSLHKAGPHSAHSYVNVKGKITEANVGNVFYSFNNFGQKAFTSENIRGRLDADFSFASYLDAEANLVQESMDGKLAFNFTDGNVINFGPFLKMKKLIFKKRPFEDVRFAPIRNTFRLKGQEIDIRKMQIESNVLTLFLEGTYSFGDKTDLSIQLPFHNFRKRGADYRLQNYEADSLSSIYLRAVEENGEVSIRLDSKRTQIRRRAHRFLNRK